MSLQHAAQHVAKRLKPFLSLLQHFFKIKTNFLKLFALGSFFYVKNNKFIYIVLLFYFPIILHTFLISTQQPPAFCTMGLNNVAILKMINLFNLCIQLYKLIF